MSDIIGVSKKYTNGIVLPGPSKRGPIPNPIVVDRWMMKPLYGSLDLPQDPQSGRHNIASSIASGLHKRLRPMLLYYGNMPIEDQRRLHALRPNNFVTPAVSELIEFLVDNIERRNIRKEIQQKAIDTIHDTLYNKGKTRYFDVKEQLLDFVVYEQWSVRHRIMEGIHGKIKTLIHG